MKTCIHCGYSAPGSWITCPSCAQPVPADPPAGPGFQGGPSPPPGYGPPPGFSPTPGSGGGYPSPPRGPSPQNPYASPNAEYSQPSPYYSPGYDAMLPTSGKAIASLVLGILSIALIYFGLILGPLAIGFYASARRDLSQIPPTHKGQGINTAGLVTGIIGTIIGVLVVFAIVFALVMVDSAKRKHGMSY